MRQGEQMAYNIAFNKTYQVVDFKSIRFFG